MARGRVPFRGSSRISAASPWLARTFTSLTVRGRAVKGSPDEIAMVELLMKQALEAQSQYNKAKGKASPEEVERLGLMAVLLMVKAQEYQLRTFGGPLRPFI